MSDLPRGLDSLAQTICTRIEEEGNWRVSSDEVISLAGLDPAEFWRSVHALRDRIGFSDAVDGFTQDTVGDLVTIMERILGPAAEEVLSRAGAFMPHPFRLDLMGELFSRAEDFVASHEISDDELASMIRFAGSIGRALPIYLEEHADPGRLIKESAEAFAESRGIPEAGRFTAARFLRELFSRHIIDTRALFAGLERRLREAAHRLGFADRQEQDGETSGTGRTDGPGGRSGARSDRLTWARRVLGLPSAPVPFDMLRRRYRELIMRFHPDVNPSGLERCKDITAAYSALASHAEKGDRA
jgi:hypothetical protein